MLIQFWAKKSWHLAVLLNLWPCNQGSSVLDFCLSINLLVILHPGQGKWGLDLSLYVKKRNECQHFVKYSFLPPIPLHQAQACPGLCIVSLLPSNFEHIHPQLFSKDTRDSLDTLILPRDYDFILLRDIPHILWNFAVVSDLLFWVNQMRVILYIKMFK